MWRTTNLFAVVALALGVVPRGWIVMFDPTGRCASAVPANWRVDAANDSTSPFAASPDGRVRATLIWSAQPTSRYIADLRGLAHPKIVHEDTPERFWIELESPPLGELHIAITASAIGACSVEIVVGQQTRDETRRVVPTIIGTLTSVH
jgi:hypothetical protein